MERAEREAIMRQGVVLPETPREREERAALEEDLQTISLSGKPLPIRARHFRPTADVYLLATRGPLAYMLRLREIEQRTGQHEAELRDAWLELAEVSEGDAELFRREWLATARRSSFDEVNDLIDRHNRWYPVESRLPMDPRTGDHALVNGRDYRLAPLDADLGARALPARSSELRPPRPDQRVDGIALLAVDVAQDGRGLLDLDARELGGDLLGRVQEVRVSRPAHSVRQVREVVTERGGTCRPERRRRRPSRGRRGGERRGCGGT